MEHRKRSLNSGLLIYYIGPCLVVFACVLLLGCANNFADKMNSQVGVMTYDQALIEFGPPITIERGEKITAGKWCKRKGEYLICDDMIFNENGILIKWKRNVGW